MSEIVLQSLCGQGGQLVSKQKKAKSINLLMFAHGRWAIKWHSDLIGRVFSWTPPCLDMRWRNFSHLQQEWSGRSYRRITVLLATFWPRNIRCYKISEGQDGSERLRYFDEQLEITTIPSVHAPSCYREAWSCSWKMLAPWTNSTSPLVCLSSHAALQMKVDSQPFFFRPWAWSLWITNSFSLGLTLPGLQLQFVLHQDPENSQRRSLRSHRAPLPTGHVLQCCQGAHITIVLRIPRPQFMITCIQCLLKGVVYKHTTHWQQSPKFLAGRRNRSIVETPWPETSMLYLWELFGCSVWFKDFFQPCNWTLRINWWGRIKQGTPQSCFSEWYAGCFPNNDQTFDDIAQHHERRIAGNPNV